MHQVFCIFLQENGSFEILAQEKFPYAVITVFKENGLKISIETPKDFYALPLNIEIENATITQFCLGSKNLIAVSLNEKKPYLLIFDVQDKVKAAHGVELHPEVLIIGEE